MQIRNPKALAFFNKYGVLATMREYPYKEGQRIIVNRAIPAEITLVFPKPIYEVLKNCSEVSGFGTTEEWIRVARKLHHTKDRLPKFMVVIQRIQKGGIMGHRTLQRAKPTSHPLL